jgi:ABC-type nickel/cobalt efflux system permease component RcnA
MTASRGILGFTLLLLHYALASAHPLLEIQYDRTIAVRLAPDAALVTYTAEMNLLAMTIDGKNIVSPADVQAQNPDQAFIRAYAARKGVLIADGLLATVSGSGEKQRLQFQAVGQPEIHPEPGNTYRITFKFRAPWSLKLHSPYQFEFEDSNFEGQPGFVKLTIAEKELRGVLSIRESTEPADLWGKPGAKLTAEQLKRRNCCDAEFTISGTVNSNRNPPSEEPEPAPTPRPSAARAVWDRGLIALFDTDLGMAVVLMLSLVFGMGHAFTPGHGKTMVAAYLVGEKGTPWHAVVLGLTSTLAHTGSVILIAIVLYSVYGNTAPAEAQGWLSMAGGLLIFLVGLWLFLQRISGKADHVHLFSDHHHPHSNSGESSNPTRPRFGWLRVILLGLGGGIIPCWDAVLLFLLAMAQGRIGFAIPVLLAFSTGLALVLMGLGLTVVWANRRGSARYGETRWFRYLPILSAAVLLVMGVFFIRDGWKEISHAAEIRRQSE